MFLKEVHSTGDDSQLVSEASSVKSEKSESSSESGGVGARARAFARRMRTKCTTSWGVLHFLPFAHQLGSTPWLGCAFAPVGLRICTGWAAHLHHCTPGASISFQMGLGSTLWASHSVHQLSTISIALLHLSLLYVARARGCNACHSSQWAAKRVTLSGKVARGMSGMLRRSLPSVASFCFVARCLPPLFFVLLDVAFRMRVAYCLLQDISCCVACCCMLVVYRCVLSPLLIVARILLVDYCWLPCCTLLIVACCFLLLLVAHVCLLLLVVGLLLVVACCCCCCCMLLVAFCRIS